MKYCFIIPFFLMASTIESKEYPGYNIDKYLKMSKQQRDKMCSHMKKAYEDAKAKECHSALNVDTGVKSCLSGEKLQLLIKQRKNDYEFACQI